MSGIIYPWIRPILFQCDPERAHHLALTALSWVPRQCMGTRQCLAASIQALGLTFPHPIGLAAGFDKNGDYLDALSKLGFSFIEIGTTTPRPQPGNSKPRLFRIPKAQALINRMGFNNNGVDALVEQVSRARYRGILGINIGKNKDTPLAHAVDDYLVCLRKVYAQASYVTINVSSPNTPDLRQLQQQDYFSYLLRQLREEQQRLSDHHQRHVPLVVKLSPDECDEALKRMADAIVTLGIEGIIATNTSCDHQAVDGLPSGGETVGLSGKPLFTRSVHCVRVLNQVVGKSVTLIGVGGIDSLSSARQMLDAGASLLQVYSGLIYQGPGLVRELVSGLSCRPLS